MIARRTVTVADAYAKALYLDGAARDDACGVRVSRMAQAWIPLPPWLRAVGIHRFVRDYIEYRRDPGGREEFADSEVILERGYDDCDGKSRLFVALCLASGLEARIRPIFPSENNFTHVQAEVRFPNASQWVHVQPNGWVVAELILEGVELGQGQESGRYDAAGQLITR